MIVGNGIANGTFMVAVNRIGDRAAADVLRLVSSSRDPYGRVLVQAPRDEPAVLVADLDLDQRRDWLDAVPVPRPRAGPTPTGCSPRPVRWREAVASAGGWPWDSATSPCRELDR